MGCGVLYHFNGEKTHLNYSTLLVPCLTFRLRNKNQNVKATASFQNYMFCRQNQKFLIYFSISQLGKNRVSKTWNESRTTQREHIRKESFETFFKLGMIVFKYRITSQRIRSGFRNAYQPRGRIQPLDCVGTDELTARHLP
jgi:hypothetical protein